LCIPRVFDEALGEIAKVLRYALFARFESFAKKILIVNYFYRAYFYIIFLFL